MKVGDLVTIVQSSSDRLVSPFVGEVGVIVATQLGKFANQDSFSVLLRDRFVVFGSSYLEVINESR
jgi:hypothetical protein